MATAFYDDSSPEAIDPIAGFGSLGFGASGTTVCPVPAMGACCQEGTCALMAAETCLNACWIWLGPGTVCTPSPCPATVGACCAVDLTCAVVTCTECASAGGGFELGGACTPNPCGPTGACCQWTGSCAIKESWACQGPLDFYLGEGVSCQPYPCLAVGACCSPDGQCVYLPQAQCSNLWLGSRVTCNPCPCMPVPTEKKSWGAIKNIFR